MGYFQVRYDSRGVNYVRRGFIRLTTGLDSVSVNWGGCALNFKKIMCIV